MSSNFLLCLSLNIHIRNTYMDELIVDKFTNGKLDFFTICADVGE